MKKLSISRLNGYCGFMSDRVRVESLNDGAMRFGGATRFPSNYYYSNIEADNYVTIKDNGTLNEVSLFIPSKIGTKKVDNSKQVTRYTSALKSYFNTEVVPFNTSGSWIDEKTHKVIIENICILSIFTSNLLREDIQKVIDLAKQLRDEMSQDCVSVYVNNSLILV